MVGLEAAENDANQSVWMPQYPTSNFRVNLGFRSEGRVAAVKITIMDAWVSPSPPSKLEVELERIPERGISSIQ